MFLETPSEMKWREEFLLSWVDFILMVDQEGVMSQ